jgi:hypothetical protein
VKRALLTVAKAAVSVMLIGAALHASTPLRLPAPRVGWRPTRAGCGCARAVQALIIGWRWHRIVVLLGGPPAAPRRGELGLCRDVLQQCPSHVHRGDAVRIWLLRKERGAAGAFVRQRGDRTGTGIVILGLMVSACVPAVWVMLDGSALVSRWPGSDPTLLAGLIVAALADKLVAG